MSRTLRRNYPNGHFAFWTLKWQMRDRDSDAIHPPQLDPKSKEGKKRLALYFADHYISFKEPGPAWFRNVFVERPQRRKARAQLKRVLQGEDLEVILNAKDPLKYWT